MLRVPDLVGRLRLDTRDLDRAKARVESFSRGAGSAFGDLDKGLVSVQKAFRNVGEGLTNFGERASVGVTLPIVAGFGLAAKAASDLVEAQNKVNVVFGQSAVAVSQFAKGAADIGLSERAAAEAAGTFGNLFVSLGLGADQAALMSTRMVSLGADLASFNNLEVGEVLDRLRSGLLGEQEAMERLGVTISETALKQKAFDLQLVDNTTSVLPATIKTQAAYALILEQTTTAQGDFARTSEGLANQTRILRAELENAAADMGAKLVPAALQLVKVTSGLLDVFNQLPDGAQNVALIGTAALAAVGPIAFLAGNALKLRAALNAAQAAAAAHSLGAGAAAAASVRLAGAVGKVGAAGAGLFFVAEGLKAITGQGDQAARALQKVLDLSTEQVVATFRRLIDIDQGTANAAFGNVLKGSVAEAQRVVDALQAAGIETGNWQQRIDDAVKSEARAIVSHEKSAAATDEAAAALRGAQGAATDEAAALTASTTALDANATAHADTAESAEAYTKAIDDLLSATVDAANAEIGQRQAAASFADALSDVADKERALADARRARTSASRDAISEERALNSVEDARTGVLEAERELARAREGRGQRAQAIADAEKALADVQRDAASAKGMRALAEANERVAEAQQRLNEAREDGGAERDVSDASERLERARLDVRDAELSLSEQREERAERERQAADAVKAAQDALAAAQLNAQTTAVQMAVAQRDLAASLAAADGKPLDYAAQYRIYRDALIDVKNAVAPGSDLHRGLVGIVDSLPPPEVKFALFAETTQADAGLERIRQNFLGLRSLVNAQGPTLFGPVGRSADEATTKVDGIRTSIGFIRRAAADPFRFVADVEPVTSSLLRVQSQIDTIRADTANLLAGIAAPTTPALAPTGAAAIRPGVAASLGSGTTVNVTNNVTALGANEDVARDLDYRAAREVARAR